MTQTQTLLDKVKAIENIMVDIATGVNYNGIVNYEEIRQVLLQNMVIKDKLPKFLITCRTPQQFWGFISEIIGYKSRRQFIWDSFTSVTNYLELENVELVDSSFLVTLKQIDESYIQDHWQKAMARKSFDPEGAITISRSLLESVCKYILYNKKVTYEDNSDLPSIYKLTASQLNLSPDQHSEKIFKQILNGCKSVIEGLGAVRNRHGDSHGKSRLATKPSSRHAELAVNLSGTMSSFLLQTYLHSTNISTEIVTAV